MYVTVEKVQPSEVEITDTWNFPAFHYYQIDAFQWNTKE